MTTQQILDTARAKLLETGSDILTDTQLLIYANLAYDDLKITTFTNDQIETALISFSNGQGTLPANFGTLYGSPVDSSNNRYPELSINDFVTKTLERAVTIEDGVIKQYPYDTPLTIKYYPSYDPISLSQNPEINSYLHELIVYGTIFRAYEDLQDPEWSKYYEDKYNIMVLKKSGNLSHYEEENQNDGAMFNPIRFI
jgi:hypothetical protein